MLVVLATAHRLKRGEDYRQVIRTGKKVRSSSLQFYIKTNSVGIPRFGFIIGRKVGNAVVRNRLRRQLKAICYKHLAEFDSGVDVVMRLFPGSHLLSFQELEQIVLKANVRLKQ